MSRFLIYGVGIDSYAATRNRELRAFKAEQAKLMRQAGRLVKAEEASLLRGGSVLRSNTPEGQRRRARGYKAGPLFRGVRLRVRRTQLDVMARIDFGPRGFYGRFHETGLPGRLPQRQTLDPTARKVEPAVLSILGNSYAVFS